MSGDLNIDEWIGNAYSDTHYVTGYHYRFSASSKKLINFCVKNISASYSIYLGKYHSSSSTFRNNAMFLSPGQISQLDYIDIYTLGYGYYNGPAMIQVLGSEY